MTMLNWLDTSSRLGHNLAITLHLVLDALVGLGGLGRAHTYNSLLIELFVGLGGFGRAHNIPVILEQPFVGLGGFGHAHTAVLLMMMVTSLSSLLVSRPTLPDVLMILASLQSGLETSHSTSRDCPASLTTPGLLTTYTTILRPVVTSLSSLLMSHPFTTSRDCPASLPTLPSILVTYPSLSSRPVTYSTASVLRTLVTNPRPRTPLEVTSSPLRSRPLTTSPPLRHC